MSVLNKLASALGRNDEVPNQILAKEIADADDLDAVAELVDGLSDKDKAVQSDCIKVLYEIGAAKPELIADYVGAFIQLLHNRNNRLVWGGMTALGAIADQQKAAEIWERINEIFEASSSGSAITQDWGVRVLATVATKDATYEARIFPYLIDFLKNCPPKDLPRHAESVLPAIYDKNKAGLLAILQTRKDELKPAQAKRVDQLIRKISK